MKRILLILMCLIAAVAASGVLWWAFLGNRHTPDVDAGGCSGSASCGGDSSAQPVSRGEDPLGIGSDATAFKRHDDYTLSDEALRKLLSYPKIREVDLHGCSAVTDSGASSLGALRNLKRLDLYKTGAGDSAVASFSALTNLAELDLSLCDNLTDDGVGKLVGLLNLRILRLSGCTSLSDRSLEAIEQLTNLEVLDLSWCAGFTTTGISRLSALPRLRELSLNNTPYDDALSTLDLPSSLRLLDLREVPALSQDAVAHIRKRYPDCRVLR